MADANLEIEVIDPARVDVGDGISIARAWDAVITGEEGIPGTIRVKVVYDEILKRAAAASVWVDRDGEGEEITTLALREVRVQWAVQRSAAEMVQLSRGDGEPQSIWRYFVHLKQNPERTYQETVVEAVILYRLASTVNIAPLKLVSERLGMSVSTATRMMARAREAGLATDLITRETYNRIRADEDRMTAPPYIPPTGSGGPSIGR